MMNPECRLKAELGQRDRQQLRRERRIYNCNIDFSSNDYLGLRSDMRVKGAFQNALESTGAGSGGSPLVSGYNALHKELEDTIKHWLGVEAVLLTSSGFAANTALMQLLIKYGYTPYIDKLAHASILHGAGVFDRANSKAKGFFRFKHNDFAHLQSLLNKNKSSSSFPIVVTEGVFSMDGDAANYESLEAVDAPIWIDDAHALGWLGQQGKGSISQLKTKPVDFITGTFGKALGCHGAFIAGSQRWIDGLINFSPEYIYSTAMPAAQAAAVTESIRIVQSSSVLQEQLLENIEFFHQEMATYGLKSNSLVSPIQSLSIFELLELATSNENEVLLQLAEHLEMEGIRCGFIRPPTVPLGTSRVRVSLSAAHHQDDIHNLVEAITVFRDTFHSQPLAQ